MATHEPEHRHEEDHMPVATVFIAHASDADPERDTASRLLHPERAPLRRGGRELDRLGDRARRRPAPLLAGWYIQLHAPPASIVRSTVFTVRTLSFDNVGGPKWTAFEPST